MKSTVADISARTYFYLESPLPSHGTPTRSIAIAFDVISEIAGDLQLPSHVWLKIWSCLWSAIERLQTSMARRGFIEVDSVLRYLDDEDRSTDFIADGSDDDLGMNSDYDYESDNLVEGILSKNNNFQ